MRKYFLIILKKRPHPYLKSREIIAIKGPRYFDKTILRSIK